MFGFCMTMKITPVKNHTVHSFKGYDAVPLKALHIAPSLGKIEQELQDIAQKEGFGLKTFIYNNTNNQDSKVILERNQAPYLIFQENLQVGKKYKPDIEAKYGMQSELQALFDISKGFVQGGNFFMGKKPTGEKWMLIGLDPVSLRIPREKIAQLYGVEKENIHFIQLQDYHLDLSIRPIGYPYVLVNSPELSLRNEQKVKGIKPKNQASLDKNDPRMLAYKKSLEQLKKAGFYPIEIGAVYGESVNFINAVVNKHSDCSISYITNSSKCSDIYVSKYQRQFEKDLKRKLDELKKIDPNAPTLRTVYFVQGENFGRQNEIMDNLLDGAGGIHCMCLEEPNFQAWV